MDDYDFCDGPEMYEDDLETFETNQVHADMAAGEGEEESLPTDLPGNPWPSPLDREAVVTPTVYILVSDHLDGASVNYHGVYLTYSDLSQMLRESFGPECAQESLDLGKIRGTLGDNVERAYKVVPVPSKVADPKRTYYILETRGR